MSTTTIALIIDCSYSMTSYDYLNYAKTDAATFVNIMQIGDQCSVVSFSNDAYLNQSLIALTNQTIIDSVAAKIQSITAVNMTNISAALQMANRQIGGTAQPHAMVLLSDGMWNAGVDPNTVLPSLPVYTIALGPHSELTLMQQIATSTSGKYNYAPGYRELAQIYNDIVAQTNVADVARNTLDNVSALNYKEYATIITSGISQAQFTINWDNVTIAYTPNTPVGEQINIALYDPNGQQFTGTPVYVAPGSVVFDVNNPIGGSWTVGCWYAGTSGSPALSCTWGSFEPPGTASLEVSSKEMAYRSGDSPVVEINFHDYKNAIDNVVLNAQITSPVIDKETILNEYAAELKSVTIPDELMHEDISTEYAAVLALNKKMNGQLLAHQISPLKSIIKGDKRHQLMVGCLHTKGTHNIQVTATGFSRRHNSLVQRMRHISLIVH